VATAEQGRDQADPRSHHAPRSTKRLNEFAFTYADQDDRDYAAFIAAIDDGTVAAADG